MGYLEASLPIAPLNALNLTLDVETSTTRAGLDTRAKRVARGALEGARAAHREGETTPTPRSSLSSNRPLCHETITTGLATCVVKCAHGQVQCVLTPCAVA